MAPPRKDDEGWKDEEWKEDAPGLGGFSDPVFPSNEEFGAGEVWGDGGQQTDQVEGLPQINPPPPSGAAKNLQREQALKENPALIPIICGLGGAGMMTKGFMAGFVYGVGSTALEGHQAGLSSQPGFGSLVLRTGVSSGASMAVWLATYSTASCACQLYRGGKKDSLNSFVGGFSAGCVSTLRTRNPRVILLSGLTQGVIFTAMETVLGGLHI
jgi:Tim17/Tim22/Tim23/Pmp24 family